MRKFGFYKISHINTLLFTIHLKYYLLNYWKINIYVLKLKIIPLFYTIEYIYINKHIVLYV